MADDCGNGPNNICISLRVQQCLMVFWSSVLQMTTRDARNNDLVEVNEIESLQIHRCMSRTLAVKKMER